VAPVECADGCIIGTAWDSWMLGWVGWGNKGVAVGNIGVNVDGDVNAEVAVG
jgi:hypothetical protein